MRVYVLPDIYDYWSLQESFHYFPIASHISRKWFLEIRQYLHFVDNSSLAQHGEPGYHRLGKFDWSLMQWTLLCWHLTDPIVRITSNSKAALPWSSMCNHHIYCDNYFTSVPLFEELLEDSTCAYGTDGIVRVYQKISRIPVSSTILPSIVVNYILTLSLITQHACTCSLLFICLCMEFLARWHHTECKEFHTQTIIRNKIDLYTIPTQLA